MVCIKTLEWPKYKRRCDQVLKSSSILLFLSDSKITLENSGLMTGTFAFTSQINVGCILKLPMKTIILKCNWFDLNTFFHIFTKISRSFVLVSNWEDTSSQMTASSFCWPISLASTYSTWIGLRTFSKKTFSTIRLNLCLRF